MAAVAKRDAAAPTDRYVGERKNQLRHGYGVYTYENKFFRYEGQWERGYKHGHGKMILGDGGYYEGTFVHGEMEGHGYRVFGLSGTIYTGQFHRGELHGQGLLRTVRGEQYEGDFVQGKKEGFGTLTEKNGSCYEGEFHGNRRHGEGSQVYSNGDHYKGDWVAGKRHGQGMLRCADGSVYDGQWRGGVFHGEGSISHSSGVSYSGLWLNGKPANEPVQLKLVGEREIHVVVVQGETFDVHFEGMSANGAVAYLEDGRCFSVSAAIQKKSKPQKIKSRSGLSSRMKAEEEKVGEQEKLEDIQTPFGYAVVPYELLQVPQPSRSSSDDMSQPQSPDDRKPRPPLPLQLGQLTRELYALHSSSTHSLTGVSQPGKGKKGVGPAITNTPLSGTRSLQDLHKLEKEESFLDTLTQPSVSVTRRGAGSFGELFLPPPIIPLPSLPARKQEFGSSTSSLAAKEKRRSPKSPSDRSKPSSPLLQGSRSKTPKSMSTQPVSPSPSRSAAPSPLVLSSHLKDEGRKERREEEDEAHSHPQRRVGVVEFSRSQSVAPQKLLESRAKFCTPGTYVLTITETTSPPFLGRRLPPLCIEVKVISNKSKTANASRVGFISNLTVSKSRLT